MERRTGLIVLLLLSTIFAAAPRLSTIHARPQASRAVSATASTPQQLGSDFTIAASPANVTISQGTAGTSTISVSDVNNFNGTISLTSVIPAFDFDVIACTVLPAQVVKSGNATLSCNGDGAGSYGVTVNASSGTLVHNVSVTFNVTPLPPTTGIVCVTSENATSCPVSVPTISGPASGPTSQFRVSIAIDSSQAIDGFEITLVTNSSILVPSSVSLTGSILTGATEIVKCIGGINKLLSSPCSDNDTSNTIQYAVVGTLTFQPATGLLFTAIYNVTGNSVRSPIVFQTGCATTSVSGGVCIIITDGSISFVPETAQIANFSNLPYFDLTPSKRIIQVAQGDTDNAEFVTVTSLNGFGGTSGTIVNLTTSVSRTTSPSPTFQVSPATVTVGVPNIGLAGLTVTVPQNTPPGNYLLNLTGTAAGLPTNSVTIELNIPAPNFSILTSRQISLDATQSSNSVITLSSIANFQGNITLNLTFPPSVIASFSKDQTSQTLNLASKGTNRTVLTVSSTSAGAYSLDITATSGSLVHVMAIQILVKDFQMEVTPPFQGPLEIINGTSATQSISVEATSGAFNATITIGSITVTQTTINGTTVPSNGISAACQPTVLTIVSISIFIGVNQTDCSVRALAIGNYTVTVSASSSTGSSHSISFQVDVLRMLPPPPPAFNIFTTPSTIIIQPGQNATSTITLNSVNGFAGTVTLTFIILPPLAFGPVVNISPDTVTLGSGTAATSILFLSTTKTTTTFGYNVIVVGRSGDLSAAARSLFVSVQNPPSDISPVAIFTFNPVSPLVDQQITFDGTGSFDPDGTVTSWTWNPGDGSGTVFSNGFFYHTYTSPGNYTVTLTVQDNGGLTGSVSQIISVRPQPAHDVNIAYLNTYPRIVVATQQVGINVQVRNDGFSNETVSVTAYANGRSVATEGGIFLQGCKIVLFGGFCNNYFYGFLSWNTTGTTPGNYTISATVFLPSGEVDPTPADNTATDGTITVFPAPVLAANPNSGSIGTKVTISGANFAPPIPNNNSFGPVWVTFDDMFLGEQFGVQNGTFTFTFDVPQAQPGTHLVKAFNLYTGARASTIFIVVQSNNGILAVTINTGSIYFPGDKAVAFILTTLNGVPTGPTSVQLTVTLYFSNGTSRVMSTASLGTGLYEAVYTVPAAGPLGTYSIVARAHMTGSLDTTSLATFEVKLNWLSSNRNTIVTATTLAGVIGLVGVAWKTGYLTRKKKDDGQVLDFS